MALTLDVCMFVPLEDLYTYQGRRQDFFRGLHNSPNAPVPPSATPPPHTHTKVRLL